MTQLSHLRLTTFVTAAACVGIVAVILWLGHPTIATLAGATFFVYIQKRYQSTKAAIDGEEFVDWITKHNDGDHPNP